MKGKNRFTPRLGNNRATTQRNRRRERMIQASKRRNRGK